MFHQLPTVEITNILNCKVRKFEFVNNVIRMIISW